MVILPVQDVDHLSRFGEFLGVEEELVPIFASLPGVPVLDDSIDGDLARTVFRGDVEQFRAVFVVLLALPVAVGPFAVHRRGACELPVSGDGSVNVPAQDEIIVEIIAHF